MSCSSFLCLLVSSCRGWWSAPVVAPHGCAPFICGGRCCRGRWLAPVVAPHVVLLLPVVGGGLVECWVVSPSRCAAWVRSFHLWWSVLSRAVVSPSRCAASRAAPSCGRWRVGGVLGGQPQSLRRMGALLSSVVVGAVAGGQPQSLRRMGALLSSVVVGAVAGGQPQSLRRMGALLSSVVVGAVAGGIKPQSLRRISCCSFLWSVAGWWECRQVVPLTVAPHGCVPFICGGRCCRGRWLAPVVAPHLVLLLPVVGGGLVECWVVSPSRCAAWVRSLHLWWTGAVAGVRSSAPVVAHVLLLLSSRDGVGRRA